MEDAQTDNKNKLDWFARIAVASLVEDDGTLMFTEADVSALLDKDLDALKLIASTALGVEEQKKS